MSYTEDDDRRRHVRLIIRAYGFNFECFMDHGEIRFKAHLIDIALGGARLKLLSPEEAQAPLKGEVVVFSLGDKFPELGLASVRSNVRWTKGRELGLQFIEEPAIILADIQRVIAP